MITKTPKHHKNKKTHFSNHRAKHKSIWGTTLLWSVVACILGIAGGLFWFDHGKLINKPHREDQAPQEQEKDKSSVLQEEKNLEEPEEIENQQELSTEQGEIRQDQQDSSLTTELQNLLEGHEATLGFSGRFDVPFKDVERLYAHFSFRPLWVTEQKITSCEKLVVDTLSHSEDEGLEKQDYTWIEKDYQKFIGQSQDPSFSPEEQRIALLKADILLTQGLIQYISDVQGERLSPKKIDKELFLEDVRVDEVTLLSELLKKDSSGCDWLNKLPPSHQQYQALKKALKAYREKAEQDQELPKFPKGPTLRKGMKGERVLDLWKVLQAKGFIDSQVMPQSVFNETLEEAVKTFQSVNNLQADGVVGAQTQNLLSLTVQETIDHIIVTMERWRWMPPVLGNKFVMINIPEFQARAYEGGKLAFSMPIIVGKSYRETPVFASKIVNIILNPTWNVPRLIAVADKLPDIQKKGPEFLVQKGFHVYRDGAEIDPRTVNWKNITTKNFNFHFRQNPGDQNALGRIRFTIVNPFDVYMHGTPDQKLFAQARRMFSSGCIRLEDPVKMAVFIFGDSQKWSRESIHAVIEENKTQTIPLKKPVAVYLSYFTVFEEENGQLAFFEDVYGQDKEILKALKSRRSRAP